MLGRVGLLACICLSSAATALAADKRNVNWHFGEHGGVTFINGTPEPLPGSQMVSVEGCATMSDPEGNLLFYTDGNTVWNRDHQVMPHGTDLAGAAAASQSALALPHPLDPTLYYIFTVSTSNSAGLCFTLVDMTADEGRGDVIEEAKNVKLMDTSSEQQTAVSDGGNGYWIIARPADGTDAWHAYHLTEEGISPTPVISNVGRVLSGSEIGMLRASPDGMYLAMAYYHAKMVALYDFDVFSGKISNERILDSGILGFYAVEFSPDSTKLYFNRNGQLMQLDLLAEDIANARTLIATYPNIHVPQLGPDDKIYVGNSGSEALSVINQPNLAGLACDFQMDAVEISGKTGINLPAVMRAYTPPKDPPTVTTAAPSNVGYTSATVGGEVTRHGGAFVTERGVCWNTTGGPTISDNKKAAGSGNGTFSTSLTGLLPNTIYYVRAYATNANGTAYGEQRTIATPAFQDSDGDGVSDAEDGCPYNHNLTAPGPNGCDEIFIPHPDPDPSPGPWGPGPSPGPDPGPGPSPGPSPQPEPEPEDEESGQPDLVVNIQSQQNTSANVGDEIPFMVEVSNQGNGTANDVTVTIPLPDGTEYVSARLIIEESAAQAAPADAQVIDGNIVIYVGQMAPTHRISVELILRALRSGPVQLTSTVESHETGPTVAFDEVVVSVGDKLVEIRTRSTVAPCGLTGVTPLAATALGLAMLPLRRRRMCR